MARIPSTLLSLAVAACSGGLDQATQADFAILQLKLDDLGSAGSDQIPPN